MINWLKKFLIKSVIGLVILQVSFIGALLNPMKASAAAPENPVLILAGGAQYTKTHSITVDIQDDTTAVAWLLTENSATPAPAAVNHLIEPVNFNLSAGDGPKTVYAWIKNGAGEINIGSSHSSIILDSTDPDISSVSITTPSSPTDNPTMIFSWAPATDATSGVDKYEFWFGKGNSIFFSYKLDSDVLQYTLSDGDQALLHRGDTYHVKIRVYDKAGNLSVYSPYSNDVLFQDNRFYPGEESILINNGALYTKSTAVHLTMSASDYWVPVQMRISESATFDGAAWIDFAPTEDFNLSAGDGLKTVYVQFRDAGGNKSSIIFDNITLDTVEPGTTLTIDETVYGEKVKIGYQAVDLTSGMDYVWLYWCKGACTEASQFEKIKIINSGASGEYLFDTAQTGEDVYSFYSVGVDKVGNQEIKDFTAANLVTVIYPAPLAPANLQVKFDDGKACLTWDVVENASRYLVRYSYGGFVSDWFEVSTNSARIMISSGKNYTFEVKAIVKFADGSEKEGAIASISVTSPILEKTEAVEKTILLVEPIVPKGQTVSPQPQVVETTPETPETQPGEIKGGETQTNGTDWTRIVITIAILIIAAGVGTAGWYAYQWWVSGENDEEIKIEEEEDKKEKPKKRSTRW